MAKDIDWQGVIFPDVPWVRLKMQGGGLAQFDDTTDADAIADDIALGKTAYVNNVKVTGTNQGGGSATVEPLSVTENGVYSAPSGVDGYSPVTVNVSGGGGGFSVGKKTMDLSSPAQSCTFDNLAGVPKAAFVRLMATVGRSSGTRAYNIVDIFWDGNTPVGNTHYRNNGSASSSNDFTVTVNGTSITFSGASAHDTHPGWFYGGTGISYELTYLY